MHCVLLSVSIWAHGDGGKFYVYLVTRPIAVGERSKARTVFARSNTAIVGSNPTEAWIFVCVLCTFFSDST
jgi:hypothetical protein